MDAPRFDGLAKALSAGRLSRRTALGRLGQGGALATTLAAVGLGSRRAAADDLLVQHGDDASGSGSEPGDSASPAELVVPGTTRDGLPEPSPETTGRLRRLTDDDRGLWIETDDQWVSLRGEVYDVRAYGALGDGLTDDWGAFTAAIEAMTTQLEVDSTSAYGRTLYVPPGTYRIARTLVLDRSVRLVGASGSGPSTDSIILVDEGIVGLLVAAADPGITGQPGRSGDGAIIERLRIVAAPAPERDDPAVGAGTKTTTAAADPATVHGIWLRAGASVRDVCVEGFGGDGIHVEIGAARRGVTESGTTDPGLATWQVAGCWVAGCGGSGLAVLGAGGGLAELVTATGNGRWGVEDASAGTAYLRCRATGNAAGSFTATGGDNRSVLIACVAADDQPRALLDDRVVVVAGVFPDGFEGGNAWTADASRMLLQAQTPGTGDTRLPTAPTLHLRAAGGQSQPHLLVSDRRGGRLAEVDPAGRLLVGPAGLTPPPAVGDQAGSQPVQLQISHPESGQSALRWVVAGQTSTWVAQARAYREASATDASPNAGGVRLTFQTPGATAQELDTLTLRDGHVGIGTITPSPAAALDVASSTQGFLPPRMTSEQRDAVAAPPEGLMLFNTTTKRLNVHDGTSWRELALTEPVVGG